MATIEQVAKAFVQDKCAKSHNSSTYGVGYVLHRSMIVERITNADGSTSYRFDWCGWRTTTTANHRKHVLSAIIAHHGINWSDVAVNNSIARKFQGPDVQTVTIHADGTVSNA